jgi:F-type H+-transporting ATPase subunit epsilon
MSFRLSIRTPEALVCSEDVDALVVPGGAGLYGVLQGHAPLVGGVAPGILKAQRGKETLFYLVGEGVADVDGEQVTILADTAVHATGLEDAAARLAAHLKQRAEPALVAEESLRSWE